MGGLLAYDNSYGMLDALSICLENKKEILSTSRGGEKKNTK